MEQSHEPKLAKNNVGLCSCNSHSHRALFCL